MRTLPNRVDCRPRVWWHVQGRKLFGAGSTAILASLQVGHYPAARDPRSLGVPLRSTFPSARQHLRSTHSAFSRHASPSKKRHGSPVRRLHAYSGLNRLPKKRQGAQAKRQHVSNLITV